MADTLTRTASGFLFEDTFTRANAATLGAAWTKSGSGTMGVSSNQGSHLPASAGDIAYPNGVELAAGVVEGVLSGAAGDELLFLYNPVSGLGLGLMPGFATSTPGKKDSYPYKRTPPAAFQNTAPVTAVRADEASSYSVKIEISGASLRAWQNGVQVLAPGDVVLGGSAGGTTHVGLVGTVAIGARSGGGVTARLFDSVRAYRSNFVRVQGLPAGYVVSIGAASAAADVDGVASFDRAGSLGSAGTTIEVYTENGNLAASLSPGGGVWGGDVYLFTRFWTDNPAPNLVTWEEEA